MIGVGRDAMLRARRLGHRAAGLVRSAMGEGAASYVAAVGVRTGARAVWGLYVPAVLSLSAYGQYNLLVTLTAVVVQLAILGAPQTIVRNAGRDVPVLGLLAHAVGIAAVAVGVVAVVTRSAYVEYLPVIVLGVLCTVAYTLLAARARSFFAFATSLRAELLGALTLLVGQAILFARYRACGDRCVSVTAAIATEAAAFGAALLVFLLSRKTRPGARDCSLRGTAALLPSVYSVGFLVILDIVIWRRVEIYFLQRSPDGLVGVAVFGLALQLATMLLLVPASIIETWQPRLSIHYRTDRDAYEAYFRSRRTAYLKCLSLVCVAGIVLPAIAITLVFDKYRPWLWYVVALVAIRLAFSASGFYSATLYATGQERRLYLPVIAGSAVALVANATLTLPYGLAGALGAQFLTQLTVSGLTIRAFRSARSAPQMAPAEGSLAAA
jgi:O-antigen/teichoic acid export membrane protein